MGAPFEVPRRLLTVEEFYRLVDAGILKEDDRVELIEGEMFEMTPIGGVHAYAVNQFNRQFASQIGDLGIIGVQNPVILLPRSVPQPDLAVLAANMITSKSLPEADDVLLVIEVADSSLRYDRDVKMPLYARYGVVEAWLWDVGANTLSVYQDPSATGYGTLLKYGVDDIVSPKLLPTVKIHLSHLA